MGLFVAENEEGGLAHECTPTCNRFMGPKLRSGAWALIGPYVYSFVIGIASCLLLPVALVDHFFPVLTHQGALR